jgi:AcrR family transcriptional regulator
MSTVPAAARATESYTPVVRRRMSADRRREQLLDTARSVIADVGLEVLTIDAVAAEGDVSRALVYQHFSDRDALLMALLEAEWTWLNDRILPALESVPEDDLVCRAMAAAASYFDARAERGPVFGALLLDTPTDSAPVRTAMRGYHQRVVRSWSDELQQAAGLDVHDAKALVILLIGSFEAAARHWWYGRRPRRRDLEAAVRFVIESALAAADRGSASSG